MIHQSIRGIIKADVIDASGAVVKAGVWQRNLLLDNGLNALTIISICDLFLWAARWNMPDSDPQIKETVSGTYTLSASGKTLTRITGSRDFDPTGDDFGKLFRAANGQEGYIVSGSSTVADVLPSGSDGVLADFATQTITLYNTRFDSASYEVAKSRTNTYGDRSTENLTFISGSSVTHKRTFIFDQEDGVVTSPTDTYNWAGIEVVSTGSPSRPFTIDDVGSYLAFPSTTQYCRIVNFIDGSHVNVDREPTVPHAGLKLSIYGGTSYNHIGFTYGGQSNILSPMYNDPPGTGRLTVAAKLDCPVVIYPVNPETSNQRLRVTYVLSVQFGPIATQSFEFSDSDNSMGMSAKTGSYVLESLSVSKILPNGKSDNTSTVLEGYDPGYLGISSSSGALDPLTPTSSKPHRNVDLTFVPIDFDPNPLLDDYPAVWFPTSGQFASWQAQAFSRTYTGRFASEDAVNTNWRAIGICDPPKTNLPLVFRWDYVQAKTETHTLGMKFKKSWNRDLS